MLQPTWNRICDKATSADLDHLQIRIMEGKTALCAWVTGTLNPKDGNDCQVSNLYSQTYLSLCKHCANLIYLGVFRQILDQV